MEPGFRSRLYTEPPLYDLVFPDTDGSLERMCRDAFRRYMPAAPASALDIGCGTARHLDTLAETVAECWGVDLLDTNVAYARATRPRLHVVQVGMRIVRLGRTFDLVTSFGNALSDRYLTECSDLTRLAPLLARIRSTPCTGGINNAKIGAYSVRDRGRDRRWPSGLPRWIL